MFKGNYYMSDHNCIVPDCKSWTHPWIGVCWYHTVFGYEITVPYDIEEETQ